MKKKIYIAALTFALTIHTLLLSPGFYLLSVFIDSRTSPYSPKSGLLAYSELFATVLISYLILFLAIRFIFYFPRKIMARIVVIFFYIFLTALFTFKYQYMYRFGGWIENTFTVEMKVFDGPFGTLALRPEPDKYEYFGLLGVGTYSDDFTTRLSKVFSDIDTQDWILTTVSFFHINGHWESHPVFIFLEEHNLQRLEIFDKPRLNYLMNREIQRGTIERIFNGENHINKMFMNYIMADSFQIDSIQIKVVYEKIDSLMLYEAIRKN
jgi:hypothetical protein